MSFQGYLGFLASLFAVLQRGDQWEWGGFPEKQLYHLQCKAALGMGACLCFRMHLFAQIIGLVIGQPGTCRLPSVPATWAMVKECSSIWRAPYWLFLLYTSMGHRLFLSRHNYNSLLKTHLGHNKSPNGTPVHFKIESSRNRWATHYQVISCSQTLCSTIMERKKDTPTSREWPWKTWEIVLLTILAYQTIPTNSCQQDTLIEKLALFINYWNGEMNDSTI